MTNPPEFYNTVEADQAAEPPDLRCGWGKRKRCRNKPTHTLQSLMGNWTPICRRHLNAKIDLRSRDPLSGLVPFKYHEIEKR